MLLNNFYTYYRYYYNIFLLIHKYFIVLKMGTVVLVLTSWISALNESKLEEKVKLLKEYIQEQWNRVK